MRRYRLVGNQRWLGRLAIAAIILAAAAPHYEIRLIVSAGRSRSRNQTELDGAAIPPVPYEPDLAMLAEWVRIWPLEELPAETAPIADLPDVCDGSKQSWR